MSSPQPTPKPDLSALRIDRSYEEETREGSSKRWIGWSIGLLLVLALAALLYAKVIAPRRYPLVELTTVAPSVNQKSEQLLTATGYLIADRQAAVAAKISGRITAVNFDVGSVVKTGDVLVTLESEDLAAQLREAGAAQDEARLEYDRQRTLFNQGVTSRSAYESASSQLKIAAARADRLRVVMHDMTVRVPFGGTVIHKSAQVGEVVAPTYMGSQPGSSGNGAVATIADLSTLELEADVNENNVGKLTLGQPAEVTVDAFPGRRFRARLRKIIPTADRAKGVVQVRVEIVDDKSGLLPEMSSGVSFLEREKTAAEVRETAKLWVSSSLIRSESGASYVLAVGGDGRVVYKPVTAGESRDGRVEIRGGLAPGERIIASPIEALQRGSRVRIAETSNS